MSDRQQILAGLARALSDGQPAPIIPRDYHGADASAPGDLVALFEERLVDYGAAVRRCGPDAVPRTITAALAERGAQNIVVPPGVPSSWVQDAVSDQPTLSAAELDGVDAVVTGCAVAIAQTGTIVLDHSAGQGRRALTLVPDYHLVVVRSEQLVHGVPAAIQVLDPRRPMTWISGPSATSDIELSRVAGVHGPRTLEVVIIAGTDPQP